MEGIFCNFNLEKVNFKTQIEVFLDGANYLTVKVQHIVSMIIRAPLLNISKLSSMYYLCSVVICPTIQKFGGQ